MHTIAHKEDGGSKSKGTKPRARLHDLVADLWI